MKRFLLLLALTLVLTPPAARATDFSLTERTPGPAHPRLSYWWKFNGASWELTPPEKYALTGGAEIRLQKADDPTVAVVCRPTSVAERDLLTTKKDDKSRGDYFLTLLPGGTTDTRLESQRENPLPVNGLMNFEAVYTYKLGGVSYRAVYMVSQASPDKATKAGECFTTVVIAPEDTQPDLYSAFQQLLATAKIAPKTLESDDSGTVKSHGMLGR